MSQCGFALGTLALFVSAMASAWTMDMLIECARCTGRDTFELVGHAAFGELSRKGTVGTVFVICWLSMVAYFVLLGDLLVPTAELAFPSLKNIGSAETERRLVVCVFTLLLSPMCFKGNLAALRFMCFASVGSVVLVCLMVLLRAAQNFGVSHLVQVMLEDKSTMEVMIAARYLWWPKDWLQALYVFPMFGVSFLCHFNALPTHQELQRPTQSRIRRVLFLTVCFTSLLYLLVSLFGYLYAGSCTCGNIMLNFRRGDALLSIGSSALGVVLMLNFPLICQPCRNAIFRLIWASSCCSSCRVQSNEPVVASGRCEAQADGEMVMMQQESPQASVAGTDAARVHVYLQEDTQGPMSSGSRPLQPFDTFAPKDATVQQSAAEPTPLQRHILTAVLLVSALLVSFFMKSIMVVWSILGSTVAFMIAFILPALFWYRIVGRSPMTSTLKRRSVVALLVIVIVLTIACTVLTCFHLDVPPCPIARRPSTLSVE